MISGFLYMLVCVLILTLAGWIWYLVVRKKMPAGQIAKRMVAVSVFFVLFLFLDCFILITMLWDRSPPKPYLYEHGYFHVINSSETSLLVDANFAYTRDELGKLHQQGINIDPVVNFMIYRDVPLPDIAEGGNNYSFRIPISTYTIALPREFEIVLRDITGTELFRLNADLIDDNMKETSSWVITESLLQCN